jgi:hypothetical protein
MSPLRCGWSTRREARSEARCRARAAPNTVLEATGHSVRCVAGVGLYCVAHASAWAFGCYGLA